LKEGLALNMKAVQTGLIAAAAVAFLAAPSKAASVNLSDVVYQDSSPAAGAGLQQWQGNLGMEFQVNSPVTVYALGAFDNGLPSELNGTTGNGIDVGIFNVSTGLLVGSSVLFTISSVVTQIGGDAFLNVTPFALGPGLFSIVALNDPNYNQGFLGGSTNSYQTLNGLGGAISFPGPSTFDSGSTLELPGNIDGPPVDRYDAGTFAATTPLPSTWTMMVVGLGLLGFVAYRRTKRSSAAIAAA
jgi:hypothetical protein